MPHNPRHVEQLMNAARAGQGRGSQYGYQMSQRPAPSVRRTISNPSDEGQWYAPNPDPNASLYKTMRIQPGQERFYEGAYNAPQYAGFRGFEGGGLPPGKDMELMQNGYTDIGDIRYILDRTTGQVSQMPRPGRGHGGGPFWDRQVGPPSDYGAQDPVPLMDAIRRRGGR